MNNGGTVSLHQWEMLTTYIVGVDTANKVFVMNSGITEAVNTVGHIS